ncbi:uncharacterized protein LOC142498782 isoform X2 [Ascaphus truei]|uniref:uncharacterized protein LOC142498782 isoform X2 n=1 Tax=Ascaphus truei TaxID=8439 RepID=UPI003F5A629F
MRYRVPVPLPQHDGHYSVTELRILATALGFPAGSLESCVPSEAVSWEQGIRTKDLHRLLDMGYFTSTLDFAYNMKSGLYNIKVVGKCLDLLERRYLSLTDIQEAKLAFSAYEHPDQKGLRAEPSFLMKAIKMCGFAISLQKLCGYLKPRTHSYVEEGRVQLYEFLDLLTHCEPREIFSTKDERVGSTDKTSRGIYQLDDMRALTMTPDGKLARHLDRRFQQRDSWLPLQGTRWPANHLTPGKGQKTANLNGTRPQPPRCESEDSLVDPAKEPWTLVTPVPHLRCHCYTPKRINPILSKGDLQNTQHDIEVLLFQMETVGERSQWELNWKLDYYLPGYRALATSRHQPVVTHSPKSVTRKSRKADVFERLSAPWRRMPSPCHAMVCDAFKLGITNKTQRERDLDDLPQLLLPRKPHSNWRCKDNQSRCLGGSLGDRCC